MSEVLKRKQVVPAILRATKRDLRFVAASLGRIGSKLDLTEDEQIAIDAVSDKLFNLAADIEMIDELYHSGRAAEIG
jgi:hypothetical protein